MSEEERKELEKTVNRLGNKKDLSFSRIDNYKPRKIVGFVDKKLKTDSNKYTTFKGIVFTIKEYNISNDVNFDVSIFSCD